MTVIDGLTLRAGTAADAPLVRELAMKELGRSPTPQRLGEILGRYPSLLAFDSGQLCAFVFGLAMTPDVLEIANLVVVESRRNQGIGTELVQRFERAVRGTCRAIIVANSDLWPIARGRKRSSIPLYERLGYRTLYSTSSTTLLIKELDGFRR
jgi:GNAT superfamily N-acetyltransferase